MFIYLISCRNKRKKNPKNQKKKNPISNLSLFLFIFVLLFKFFPCKNLQYLLKKIHEVESLESEGVSLRNSHLALQYPEIFLHCLSVSGYPNMDVTTTTTNLRSSFFSTLQPRFTPFASAKSFTNSLNFTKKQRPRITCQVSAATVEKKSIAKAQSDVESLFSSSADEFENKKYSNKQSNTGASSISSGVKLENISKSYKGVTVLKDVTWEVKKGEKVGLVGVNGAGKTTQLRIIAGQEEPDSGNVIKAKSNMKIAFLSQEFEVSMSRTVREEFMSAFEEEMEIAGKLERVQKALESAVDDMDLMGRLLDEFDLLQRKAQAVNLDTLDAKVSKLMPELGFTADDGDRLVASFSSGWQMRMSLGKILLQVYFQFRCCINVYL